MSDITEDLKYDDNDLDRDCNILVKAEEIRSNTKYYQAVAKHMKAKARKINRIADLRDVMAEEDLSGDSRAYREKEMDEVED